MKSSLVISYWSAFFFYALAFVSNLLRKNWAQDSAAILGLTANAAGLVIITVCSGQAPAFNLFESMMLAALILSGISMLFSRQEEKLPNVRIWVWVEILIIMGIAAFTEKAPSNYLYDHNFIPILLFRTIRTAVVSLTLFSSALYIQSRFDGREDNALSQSRAHQGRNFLILGAILFLTAEYIGILWCLRGWGDFWMWSAGFFQSTLIVVFFMLAVHVPGSNHRPGNWRPRLGIFCGFLIFILTVIRSMF